MSGVIYYFSATGNSLYAAKVIAKKINAKVVQISYNTEKSCNQNVIGFVYPTFYWGLPEMVATFVKNLNIKDKRKSLHFCCNNLRTFKRRSIRTIK